MENKQMDETAAPPMNLVQKLASIRKDMKSIKKQGHNSFQNYDYLRAEDIAGEMGDRLAEMNVILARRNLSFTQNIVTVTKDGNERADVHVIVCLDYVFINGDNEGFDGGETAAGYEEVVVASVGEGRDSGDKAVAKALTNALKYALTQPLMMRVGDDPEADSQHDKDTGKQTHKPAERPNRYISGDTSKAQMASSGQLRLLDISAERKIGVGFGLWIDNRLKELNATRAALPVSDYQMLINELADMHRGEDSQEPPPEEDPFA
jgi:hypothetical protein